MGVTNYLVMNGAIVHENCGGAQRGYDVGVAEADEPFLRRTRSGPCSTGGPYFASPIGPGPFSGYFRPRVDPSLEWLGPRIAEWLVPDTGPEDKN